MTERKSACEDHKIRDRSLPSEPRRPFVERVMRRGPHRSPRGSVVRSRENRILGGVCGGLGERVGVDPTLIRIFVIPLALLAGGGVVLYIAAWILLPRSGDASIARRVLDDRRELRNIVALSTIVLCALFVLQALGLHGLGTIAWPLLLGVLGLFVVWRGAPTDERTHLQRVLEKVPVLGVAAPDDKRNLAARGVLGVVLVGLGLGGVA